MGLILSLWNVKETPKENSLNDDSLEEREIRKDEIVRREKVEGTPFTIVQQQEKTFIAMGMYKVSQDMTYRECKQAIKEKEWNLILNIARLITMDEIAVAKETQQAIREKTVLDRANGQPKSYRYK